MISDWVVILSVFVSVCVLEAFWRFFGISDDYSLSRSMPNFRFTFGMSINRARTLIGLKSVVDISVVVSIVVGSAVVVDVVVGGIVVWPWLAWWATPDAPCPWHWARNVWSDEYFDISIFHGLKIMLTLSSATKRRASKPSFFSFFHCFGKCNSTFTKISSAGTRFILTYCRSFWCYRILY